MLYIFFYILYCSSEETNCLNISLKQNERKVIDLNGFLLVFINSFQYSDDDITFQHTKNGQVLEYKPSNHLAFREGSLEVFSKKGVSFLSWLLPSNSCPSNNYVVEPSQMATIQVLFERVRQFCLFTHFNFPFAALLIDTDYNFSSNVMIPKSNWIPIKQKQTYSLNQPFILFGKTNTNLLGYASITYTTGDGKCKVTQIKEGNINSPDIDILCQNYMRKFNMWLWGFIIILCFAIVLYILIYFRFINLNKFWNPPRISESTYANRVEEHLVIEEPPENSQIDDTTNESAVQQQPPHDAL